MSERKKILYIMHVPWGWIKQRPHFFADLLSEDYDVDVFYKKSTIVSKKKLLTKQEDKNNFLRIKGFRYIPCELIPLFRYLHLEWINWFISLFQLPPFRKYDYIWITNPRLYSMISRRLSKNNKVIYDCMDDVVEFPIAKRNPIFSHKLLKNEIALLSTSSIVICSADYLKKKILDRAQLSRRIDVLNNAIALPDIDIIIDTPDVLRIKNEIRRMQNVFMYIGAISEWFDFDTVCYALKENPQVHVVLIGPSDVLIPVHDRIHHFGTVERKFIFSLMSLANALIMPFYVNELIRSVNPVKVYEYIYSAKPIIIARYEETEKFLDYVYLYSIKEEFSKIMSEIFIGSKKAVNSANTMKSFSAKNTWHERYRQLKSILNEYE